MKEFNSNLKQWDNNYHQYMDIDLLQGMLEEFDWIVTPDLKDELPDGIILKFHRVSFFFSESFLNFGDISVNAKLDGESSYKPLFSLLDEVKATKKFDKPSLRNIVPGQSSKENVRDGIWNKLVLIRHYLPSLLTAD